MTRYEVLNGDLVLAGDGLAPLTLTLPMRKTQPSGFCVALTDEYQYRAPCAVSVQVDDGQPLFEGVPAAHANNGRINFTHEFVALNGAILNGAEMRITPICAADDYMRRMAISIILQYNE